MVPLIRHLIQTLLALVFVAFGAGAAIALPLDWAQVDYSTSAEQLTDQLPNLAMTARALPLNGNNVAINGASFGGTGDLRVLDEVASLGDVSAFLQSSTATNTAGAGRFRPSQPLDAAGYPIVRTNDRSGVLVQPNGSVTCAQHSCGMVLV